MVVGDPYAEHDEPADDSCEHQLRKHIIAWTTFQEVPTFRRNKLATSTAMMVCDYDAEDALYVEANRAIEDSGCTSPVMGEDTWEKWLSKLEEKGLKTQILYGKVDR